MLIYFDGAEIKDTTTTTAQVMKRARNVWQLYSLVADFSQSEMLAMPFSREFQQYFFGVVL